MSMTLVEEVLFSLKNTNCRLKPSSIEGIGVFAIVDIAAGTQLFIGSLERKYVRVGLEELAECTPEVIDMVKGFFVPDETNGKYIIPEGGLNAMDISFFLNHSTNANVTTPDGERFFTSRDVKAGEELVSDYETYDPVYDTHQH